MKTIFSIKRIYLQRSSLTWSYTYTVSHEGKETIILWHLLVLSIMSNEKWIAPDSKYLYTYVSIHM